MTNWQFYLLIGISVLSFLGALTCFALLLRMNRRSAGKSGTAKPVQPGPSNEIPTFIRAYAAEFNGLYEGLYQAANNPAVRTADAYEEWCDRVDQIGDPFARAFRQTYSRTDPSDETRYRRNLAELLRAINAAGIRRDREAGETFTADEALSKAYLGHDGGTPRPGAACTVIKPAWLCADKVIEQGLVIQAQDRT